MAHRPGPSTGNVDPRPRPLHPVVQHDLDTWLRRRASGMLPLMSEDVIARLSAALEGRYIVERELGEGGMATVYLAEDVKHRRKGRAGYPRLKVCGTLLLGKLQPMI